MNRKEFYQSNVWRKQARYVWLKQMCLCNRCGRAVYVNGISDYLPKEKRLIGIVHHKTYLNDKNIDNLNISLNEENLEGLCIRCHDLEHNYKALRKGVMFDEDGNLVQVK